MKAGSDRRQDRRPARPPGCRGPALHSGPVLPSSGAAPGRRRVTVRVRSAAGARDPGGLRTPGAHPRRQRRRVGQALIFTPCYSRHQFVWPTFPQTTEKVIRGFEAAWSYFGAVFPVVIPDNMRSIVITAENIAPRFNDTFIEYAQSRGSSSTQPGWATPTDKPRVQRVVHYVQRTSSPESPSSTGRCRRRAETWCTDTAGHAHPRDHPVPADRVVPHRRAPPAAARPGAPLIYRSGPTPRSTGTSTSKWARPSTRSPSLGRPHPAGQAGTTTVKLYLKGELIKVHARKPPGGKPTDNADMPTGTEIYATGDIARFGRLAADHGPAIGRSAAALLDTPLPWTKMRQVYRLLGPGQEVGGGTHRAGLQPGPGGRVRRREPDCAMLQRAEKPPKAPRPSPSWFRAASPAIPPSSPLSGAGR